MNFNLRIISDSNLEILRRILLSKKNKNLSDIKVSPFGQLYQSIYSFIDDPKSIIFISTFPESHIEEFKKALFSEEINSEKLLSEIDDYAEMIINLSSKCKYILIPAWVTMSHHKTQGLIDWKSEFGINNLIAEMNLRLCKRLRIYENIFILDPTKWQLNSEDCRNSKMWYLSKVPFQNKILDKISDDIINSIDTICGSSKKLIIVDLDNTLWGGILGDVGIHNIKVGGHDHIGEAYADFQKALLALYNQGILLAIASKNDEKNALEVFDSNNAMILKKKHFVHWEINWNNKSENITKIAKELNLGLDSIVFIDDNPIERDFVKQSLPEILVPNWSIDPSLFAKKLNEMRCFDQMFITDDDKKRNQTYHENKKRKASKIKTINKEEWLKQLKTTAKVQYLNASNLTRIVQLFNKTNQFNLASRRLSDTEIKNIYTKKDNFLMTISVKDKFGDLGIIGLIGLTINSDKTVVNDLILSCRAMGRGIEETMMFLISKKCKEEKLNYFELEYKKTERNNPIYEFLKKSDLDNKNNLFFTDSFSKIKKPNYLEIYYF